jgi:hypothetical protein
MFKLSNDQFKRRLTLLAGGLLLSAGLSSTAPTATPQQDPGFRLLNLERRVDQLQMRLDFIERNQQAQALAPATTSQYNNELVLELQRQQLSLAQQVIEQERRMLDMKKALDRLAEAASGRGERPKESTPPKSDSKTDESSKPKAAPRKH